MADMSSRVSLTWPSPSTPSLRPRRGIAPPSRRRAGAARAQSRRGPRPR